MQGFDLNFFNQDLFQSYQPLHHSENNWLNYFPARSAYGYSQHQYHDHASTDINSINSHNQHQAITIMHLQLQTASTATINIMSRLPQVNLSRSKL